MKAAVYAGTRNFYNKMIPAMKSLLCNSDVDKIYFLIEDDEFPKPLPPEVECINVNTINKWFTTSCPNYNPWWSMMPLYRTAYAKIFPEWDRILSLDVDTIVMENISELWNINMDNYYLAGVRDVPWLCKGQFYMNGGVVMHNLKKIREEGKDDKSIQLLNTNKYSFSEQDVFNLLYKEHILELPSCYNSAAFFENYDGRIRKIIHYVGDRNYIQYDNVQRWVKAPIIRP